MVIYHIATPPVGSLLVARLATHLSYEHLVEACGKELVSVNSYLYLDS